MRNKFKSVLITFMLVATVLFVTACSNEETPYDINNGLGYNVSVRYDANGGTFHTNTDEIVDSYNISGMATNANGKVELALIAPDNSLRGTNEAFTASKKGYFMAGWYTERTENGTDSEGNVIYTYSGRWDFENDLLEVDPNGSYSADQPVVTLYAAWVPMYEVNYYDKNSGELLLTDTFNPMTDTIEVPQWSQKTGGMDMRDFPDAPEGYTFQAAYYADGSAVETELLQLPDTLDLTTGTAGESKLDVYLEWIEGEWYHIYTAEQLYKSADPNGCYVLHADLDFSDEKWPGDFAFKAFHGTFDGNGYTIKNVTVTTTNKRTEIGGLFGEIGAEAVVKNVTFTNITYELTTSVDKGTPAYGLFAGRIASGAAISDVTLANGTIKLDSDSRMSETGSIGLVCGSGSTEGITYNLDNLTAEAGGSKPETVKISITGEQVTFVIEK